MNIYKVLLVDDEPEIRDGLQEVVDFTALGFTVVGEAGNGREALQLAESLQPDLIITDIRMPLMDGLTMAAEVKKLMPTVQFVILSGYDEFEYARQAIEIMALRYLLKPITSQEFIAIMQDVHARMDEAFERRSDITRLQAHFDHSLPILRERLLASLLLGELEEAQALAMAQRYGMALQAERYLLGIIRTAHGEGAAQVPAMNDPELLTFAVGNIAGEIMSQYMQHYLLRYDGDLVLLMLLEDAAEERVHACLSALEEVRMNVQYYLKAPVYIGVSAPCDTLCALPGCIRQAHTALNHAGLVEQSQVICITDVAPGSRNAVLVDEYTLRQLSNSLKGGDAEKAEAIIHTVLEGCQQRAVSIQEYRACLLELLLVFVRVARDMDLPSPEDVQQDVLDQILKCPPLSQAIQILSALCENFAQAVTSNRASSARLLAEQAVEHMQAHYMEEDLSIEKVAGRLHISVSYLSALFKKEMHKTVLQYITELRMDKAMTLLASGTLRTSEIAVAVGISDPGYFSYAFKRHFGVSPSRVRKKEGDAHG